MSERTIIRVEVGRLTSEVHTLAVSVPNDEEKIEEAIEIIAAHYPHIDPLVIEILPQAGTKSAVVTAQLRKEKEDEQSGPDTPTQLQMSTMRD